MKFYNTTFKERSILNCIKKLVLSYYYYHYCSFFIGNIVVNNGSIGPSNKYIFRVGVDDILILLTV
jgi:hypothetical protein